MSLRVRQQQQGRRGFRVTQPALVLLDGFKPAVAIFVEEPLHEFIRFRESFTDELYIGAFHFIYINIPVLVYLLKGERS